MSKQRTYQVKEVAELTRISIRTLHHYDEIGLLVPHGRTSAGYRVYDDDDLLRLQQILIGRELGFALEEIRRSLDDPSFDRKQALLAQKQQLQARAQHTAEMIRAVDAALVVLNEGSRGTTDMQQIFDGFDPAHYEAEAKARWGHTDSYRESAKRTKGYQAEDWAQLQAEQATIYSAAFAALEAQIPADSSAAMDIAERHRSSIDRWFYPCSHAHHARLADGYEADPRFAENIDRFGAGLTPYLAAAIRANARRHGA